MSGPFDPRTLLQAAYWMRYGAREMQRAGVDAGDLLTLAAIIDPRPVITAADADDATITPIRHRRDQWRAASARYRARKRTDRLAAAG